MNRTVLLFLALGASVAGLLVLATPRTDEPLQPGRAIVDARTPGAPSLANDSEELRETLLEIRATLARIEDRLTAIEARETRPTERIPLRSGEDEPNLSTIVADIAELKRSLDERFEESQELNRRPPTLAELKEQNPDTKWNDLQNIIDLWHTDEESALEEMRLLSFEDVIRRYGAPTEMWSNEKGTNWIYGEGTDPAGGYQTEVWLLFRDGFVTMLGVK